MRRKAPLSDSVEERVEAGACDDRMYCRTAYTVGAITEILNAFGARTTAEPRGQHYRARTSRRAPTGQSAWRRFVTGAI